MWGWFRWRGWLLSVAGGSVLLVLGYERRSLPHAAGAAAIALAHVALLIVWPLSPLYLGVALAALALALVACSRSAVHTA